MRAAKALYGDGEYYFFSPRDRKYPNGIRPNRPGRERRRQEGARLLQGPPAQGLEDELDHARVPPRRGARRRQHLQAHEVQELVHEGTCVRGM